MNVIWDDYIAFALFFAACVLTVLAGLHVVGWIIETIRRWRRRG